MIIQSDQVNTSSNDINLLSDSNVINSIDGNDSISAGIGNDILFGSNGADILDGGEGIDTIDYRDENNFGVTVDLFSNSASGGQAEGDLISNFENISGSEFDDVLTGSDDDNELMGREGSDTLTGGEGDDIFQFEEASDSTLSDFDTIVDLNIEEDRIVVEENAIDLAAVNQFGSVDFIDEANIQRVLNESEFAADDAATFSYNSQLFLVLNDGVSGYQANSDGIIEITNVEGLISSINCDDMDDITEVESEEIDFSDAQHQEATDTDNDSQTIDVDDEFDGDIESAISSADDGDTILLGDNTYFTDGIYIDKDITIDGGEGSIIDGGGTSTSIIDLASEASGTTIQDLRITNGNNGISSDGAFDLTIQNLEIDNIGLNETIRDGQNNTGIALNYANGLQLTDTYIHDVGRKGVGINDTDRASVSGLTIENVNLAAEHSQSFDAAGIKLFNTNDVVVSDLYLSEVNAVSIWNDTTNGTVIRNNTVENVGNVFLAPDFNQNVNIAGIYNEKSSNSVVRNNRVTAVDGFLAFNATAFSTETMTLGNNNFSSSEINTTDFWVNEEAEKLIATTEDPNAANFDLIAEDFFGQVNIG